MLARLEHQLHPIHLDITQESITISGFSGGHRPSDEEVRAASFGNLLSANANPSTLVNWGENSWVTLHQTGNEREYEYYGCSLDAFYSNHLGARHEYAHDCHF